MHVVRHRYDEATALPKKIDACGGDSVTTDQPAKPASWWPTLLFAVMTVLTALLAVEESLRHGFRWNALLLPTVWTYLTVNRLLRTVRQRAGRPPWWVGHPRATLALNVTVLAAIAGFGVYCLTRMGPDRPLYIGEAIICAAGLLFGSYVAVLQWRLQDAETDWPWWDQPWWRWRIEKSPNTQ
jgi:hypothetical protein